MNIFVKTINRSFGFGRFAQKRRIVHVTLLIWVKVTNVLMAQFLLSFLLLIGKTLLFLDGDKAVNHWAHSLIQ